MSCHNFYYKLGCDRNYCRKVSTCDNNISEIIVYPNPIFTMFFL